MLDTLFKKGYLDYNKIILENAKILGLNAEEAFVLIKILDNYYKTNSISIIHPIKKKISICSQIKILLLKFLNFYQIVLFLYFHHFKSIFPYFSFYWKNASKKIIIKIIIALATIRIYFLFRPDSSWNLQNKIFNFLAKITLQTDIFLL